MKTIQLQRRESRWCMDRVHNFDHQEENVEEKEEGGEEVVEEDFVRKTPKSVKKTVKPARKTDGPVKKNSKPVSKDNNSAQKVATPGSFIADLKYSDSEAKISPVPHHATITSGADSSSLLTCSVFHLQIYQ